MFYSLCLEAIGDNLTRENRDWRGTMFELPTRKTWAAEIVGLYNSGKYVFKFLRGSRDYSQANSVGSRGVYVYYNLQSGKVYCVNHWSSWRCEERWMCRVDERGEMHKISHEEVLECLKLA